jgi:hypothetical protein
MGYSMRRWDRNKVSGFILNVLHSRVFSFLISSAKWNRSVLIWREGSRLRIHHFIFYWLCYGCWNKGNPKDIEAIKYRLSMDVTASVIYSSQFLATDPEVSGSILGATNFLGSSESGTGSTQPRQDNWSSGSGSRKSRLTAVAIRCADHSTPYISTKVGTYLADMRR